MSNPPEYIHVATLIRLNAATTALEIAAHDLDELINNMPRDLPRSESDGYRETLTLVYAALDIDPRRQS